MEHRNQRPEQKARDNIELTARDKTSLGLFGLKDKSLTDLDSLPEPGKRAEEIEENLGAGLLRSREVLPGLEKAS